MSKRKILVSAYGCEPFRGSEAGVGWNWILQMAKANEVFAIVRANDQEKIEANIPNDVKDNLHFYYYDNCVKKIKNGSKRLYIYYFFWQIGIIKIIKKLRKKYTFDYSIHLTFGSVWMPTFLPFFKIPFIWGPVGGADAVPKPFIKTLPLKQRIVQRGRYFLIKTGRINPCMFIPSRKAKAILCRTENNRLAIPKKYRDKSRVVLETAMEPEVFKYKKDYGAVESEPVKIIISGRLIPLKNINTLIDTVESISEKGKIEVTIIGDGPEKAKIEKRIHEKGLENIFTLKPRVPREELLENLKSSDIYFFTSLKEAGSWSLMEAMSVGLPVLCYDWAGMGLITDDNCAFKVKPQNYNQSVEEFSEALSKLINSPNLRKQMGERARERILQKFNWDEKGIFVEKLFEELEK